MKKNVAARAESWKVLLAMASFCISAAADANTWSTCHRITAVSNYIAYSNTVYAILTPGIPGCSSDALGAVVFRVGEMGVTADSLKTLLATATAAYLGEKSVMIYYNNATSSCFSNVISVGGYAGQC